MEFNDLKIYKCYTDGSCRANGSSNAVGAWAFAIIDNENNLIYKESGTELNTTNQRMELEAAARCCEYIHRTVEPKQACCCYIYSDSAYLINCINQGWYKNWIMNGWITSKKTPVENKDLWERLIPYFRDFYYNFNKVAGHKSNDNINQYWNNYVDNLAQTASIEARREKCLES